MKTVLLAVLKFYRKGISPLLPGSCRFAPSCSEYSALAIRRHGALKGVWLTCRRLLRCHPFHGGGYDPVPGELDGLRDTGKRKNAETEIPRAVGS